MYACVFYVCVCVGVLCVRVCWCFMCACVLVFNVVLVLTCKRFKKKESRLILLLFFFSTPIPCFLTRTFSKIVTKDIFRESKILKDFARV